VSVTIPAEGVPPRTELGFRLTVLSVEAVIASFAVCWRPANVAVIVAETDASTPAVVTVKVAEVAPLATVNELGTVAEDNELDRATDNPELGAGPERVTVPAEGEPAGTVVGFKAKDTRVGAVTERFAD